MSEPQIPDEAVQAYVLGYANAPPDVRHPDRVRAGLAAAYPILAAQPDSERVDLAHYSAALDEVYRLRCALVYEARVIEAHLDLLTFPKSRRQVAEEQIDRMRRAARGDTGRAYAHLGSGVAAGLLSAAGASETLTRGKWEGSR